MSYEVTQTVLHSHHPALRKHPELIALLLGLAEHASADGTGAYPSALTLAHYIKKSVRTVRRQIKLAKQFGLIVEGDQDQVSRYSADRRPVVYNVNLVALRAFPRHGAASNEDGVRGDTYVTRHEGEAASKIHRGDAGVTSRGDIGVRSRDDTGVTQTALKPSGKPSGEERTQDRYESPVLAELEMAEVPAAGQTAAGRADLPLRIDNYECWRDFELVRLQGELDQLRALRGQQCSAALGEVAALVPATGRANFRRWADEYATQPVHVVHAFLVASDLAEFGNAGPGALKVAIRKLEEGKLKTPGRSDTGWEPFERAGEWRDRLDALDRRGRDLQGEVEERQAAHNGIRTLRRVLAAWADAGGFDAWMTEQSHRADLQGRIIPLLDRVLAGALRSRAALRSLGAEPDHPLLRDTEQAIGTIEKRIEVERKAAERRAEAERVAAEERAEALRAARLAEIDPRWITAGLDLGPDPASDFPVEAGGPVAVISVSSVDHEEYADEQQLDMVVQPRATRSPSERQADRTPAVGTGWSEVGRPHPPASGVPSM